MKAANKREMTAAAAASALRELADQIERYETVLVQDVKVSVPAKVEFKVKYHRKHEREKLSFKLSWPSALTDDASIDPDPVFDHYTVPSCPPHDFKQLKKEMQYCLFSFQRLSEAKECPPADDIARYRRLQNAFAAAAKPEWGSGIAEAETATIHLEEAVGRNDSAGVAQAIERLFEIKKVWHARYK